MEFLWLSVDVDVGVGVGGVNIDVGASDILFYCIQTTKKIPAFFRVLVIEKEKERERERRDEQKQLDFLQYFL